MVEISYLGFCALGALRNPKLSRRQYHGQERYYFNDNVTGKWLPKGPKI